MLGIGSKDKVEKTSTKEYLLSLIATEKEIYNNYCQLCIHYHTTPDPIATAHHLGKLETLQQLMKEAKIDIENL